VQINSHKPVCEHGMFYLKRAARHLNVRSATKVSCMAARITLSDHPWRVSQPFSLVRRPVAPCACVHSSSQSHAPAHTHGQEGTGCGHGFRDVGLPRCVLAKSLASLMSSSIFCNTSATGVRNWQTACAWQGRAHTRYIHIYIYNL